MRFDGKNVATTDMNHKYRSSASGFTPRVPVPAGVGVATAVLMPAAVTVVPTGAVRAVVAGIVGVPVGGGHGRRMTPRSDIPWAGM
ncbi:MAG TPA: hypothetical protein VES60_01885 [Nakamurella sp.]|nr:hypothetical protein [Nakamurella sp.]